MAVSIGCTNSNLKLIKRNVLNIYLIKYITCKSPTSCSLDFHSYILERSFLSFSLAAKSFCFNYGLFIPKLPQTVTIGVELAFSN